MYYVGVARGPLANRTVIFLALLAAGCSGNLNPIRPKPLGQDGSALIDSSVGQDAPISPDSSVPVVCPDLLIGYATMSNQGGEPDGSVPPMPLLSGGVTGGAAGPMVVVNATDSNALVEFSTYVTAQTPGPLTILIKGMLSIPATPDGGDTGGEQIRVSANKTVIGANVFADPGLASAPGSPGAPTLTGVSHVVLRNLASPDAERDDGSDKSTPSTSRVAPDLDRSLRPVVERPQPGYRDLVRWPGRYLRRSDFVTVSWTHYHDHGDTGLIGRSDSSDAAAQDVSKNHVTYDHDLFTNLRTGPRARFGRSTCSTPTSTTSPITASPPPTAPTCGSRGACSYNVAPPVQPNANFGPVTTILDSPAYAGYVDLVGNVINSADGNGQNVIPATQVVPWMPPYPYTPDSASSAAFVVPQCVGPGHIMVPPAP